MRKPHHVLHLRSTGGFLGAENVIIELCRHASAADVRSTIGIVFDVGDPPPELEAVARRHGIPVVRFDCRSRVDVRAIAEIRRLAIDAQVDIIHTHGYREDLYALLAMTGAKKVATNHLWKKTTPSLRAYARVDGLMLRLFDAVVGVSQPIVADLLQAGVQAARCRVIPNGIDTARFTGAVAASRRALGVPDGALLVGMISSLTPEKGHDLALQSLTAAQPQAGVPLHLLIVGDGPERQRIEERAVALGVAGQVTLLGSRRDVPEILAALDVYVLASSTEGLPMALLEAMAAGKPAIATAVGDVPSVVENGVTGLLIPSGAPGPLAAALTRLATDRELSVSLGRRAQERVSDRYSASRMSALYGDLYAECMGE